MAGNGAFQITKIASLNGYEPPFSYPFWVYLDLANLSFHFSYRFAIGSVNLNLARKDCLCHSLGRKIMLLRTRVRENQPIELPRFQVDRFRKKPKGILFASKLDLDLDWFLGCKITGCFRRAKRKGNNKTNGQNLPRAGRARSERTVAWNAQLGVISFKDTEGEMPLHFTFAVLPSAVPSDLYPDQWRIGFCRPSLQSYDE
jgi:hypothetical protein